MKHEVVMTSLILLFWLHSTDSLRVPIYIGGFFPMKDGFWDGSGILPAAEMAITDVNDKTDILVDYELRMVWNNSKCAHGPTIRSLFHQIYTEPTKIMLVGAGCSSQTSNIAETVPPWNLVQVSHASSSPDLDDRSKYPLLFRAHPSERVTNSARVALMRKLGWKRAALLHTSDGSFSSLMTDLQKLFDENNITVIIAETFSSDPRQALQNIKRKDGRIIVAAAFEDKARKILCEAHSLDMTSSLYTWMFPGWLANDWWSVNDTSCDTGVMRDAAKGYIGVEVSSITGLDDPTNVSKTAREFEEAYTNLTAGLDYGGTEFAAFGYDSIWIIAYALDAVAKILQTKGKLLTDFTYDSKDMADLIFAQVNATNIAGVTGHIKFDYHGMRIGSTRIHQLQDNKKIDVMYYDDRTRILSGEAENFIWNTDTKGPPSDGPLIINAWRSVSRELFYFLTVIAVIGDIFVIFLLAMNIRFKHRRIIKMSSPNLNYLICGGAGILYTGVIVNGVIADDQVKATGQSNIQAVSCLVSTWMLVVGFSLTIGSVVVKDWRIYRIVTQDKSTKQKNIKDWHLLCVVAILVLIDVIILTSWTIIDPLIYRKITMETEETGPDTFTEPYIITCSSDSYIWLGVLLASKGLLLLFGSFIALETRNIKLNLLNDAKEIALTIYTVLVLAGIGVPISFVVKTNVDFRYGVTSTFIILGTTVMLASCLWPKVYIVMRISVADEDVMIANMKAQSVMKSGVDMTTKLRVQVLQLEGKLKKVEDELQSYKVSE